jgi:hypothetical protein
MTKTTTKGLLNLKMQPRVREEFKLAAALRGASMSAVLTQHAFRVIREEQEQNPAAFAYLNAGGSIDRALEIAREFGRRPLSEEDRIAIRKLAEVEKNDFEVVDSDKAKPSEKDRPEEYEDLN